MGSDGSQRKARRAQEHLEVGHEEKVTVRVTTPSLEALSASGGVDAAVTDVATLTALKRKLSGGVELR